MTKRIHALTTAAALATVVIGGNAFAAGVKLLTTIDIPGEELKLFDIGVVDAAASRYYIADRSNKAVDIFDTKANKYVGRIEGFVGVVMKDGKPVGNLSGPNGVAVDSKTKTLWVGDGDSTIKVVDLKANPPKIVDTIKLGGQKRADELGIDEKGGIVLVFNNADKPAFGTFISTKPGHKVLGKLEIPEATDGVEQSQFVAKTGLFYASVPEWKEDNKQGGVAVIDPKTMKMLRLVNIPDCQPTGLMQGPGRHQNYAGDGHLGLEDRKGRQCRQGSRRHGRGLVRFRGQPLLHGFARTARRAGPRRHRRQDQQVDRERPDLAGRPFGRGGLQDQARLRAAHREPELPQELHRSLWGEVAPLRARTKGACMLLAPGRHAARGF
jgi:hypothetical protein